jgi:adenylyl-sulfate kinase
MQRAVAYGHKSHVIWLTGVPGAGKSTLARYLERELFKRQVKTFVLDGENLRFGLSADLGFTDTDRSEQARRASEVARLFQLAGLVVIVALVSPFAADREYARALAGDENFLLVHVDAPRAVLTERDPHGLYSRAASGAAVAVPGLNSPYEPPVRPDLHLDTSAASVESTGAQIVDAVMHRVGMAPAPRPRGFCVWLTGLSGAGKSTIAQALTARLRDRGREVTLLDGDVVRTHLSRGLGFSRADRDANVTRIAFVADEVVRHRGIAVCAIVSPYESTREECRRMLGVDQFVLAHVSTPLAICEERDPKGLYARARRGEIPAFTGIDDPYEPPAAPDLVLTTTDRTPEASARIILDHLEQRGLLPLGR